MVQIASRTPRQAWGYPRVLLWKIKLRYDFEYRAAAVSAAFFSRAVQIHLPIEDQAGVGRLPIVVTDAKVMQHLLAGTADGRQQGDSENDKSHPQSQGTYVRLHEFASCVR